VKLTVEIGDKYIHFECSNMVGYDKAKRNAKSMFIDWHFTIEEICSNAQLAWLYDFEEAVEYAIEYSEDCTGPGGACKDVQQTYPGPYEVNSIMHYPPAGNMKPKNDWQNLKDLVLTRWKEGGPDFKPPSEVTAENSESFWCAHEVTTQDYYGIAAIYPWSDKKQ
jgi:hypothetical protein